MKNETLMSVLSMVIDPELMVNIVDLGLVYEARFDESNKLIQVEMTLTTPGCPMGQLLMDSVKEVLTAYYPDYQSEIDLVWSPAWSPDRITEAGKQILYSGHAFE